MVLPTFSELEIVPLTEERGSVPTRPSSNLLKVKARMMARGSQVEILLGKVGKEIKVRAKARKVKGRIKVKEKKVKERIKVHLPLLASALAKLNVMIMEYQRLRKMIEVIA